MTWLHPHRRIALLALPQAPPPPDADTAYQLPLRVKFGLEGEEGDALVAKPMGTRAATPTTRHTKGF
jgi:hypothetical protein